MPSETIVMIPMRGDENERTMIKEYARPVTFADWVRIACAEKLQRDQGVFLPKVDNIVSKRNKKRQKQTN